MLFNNCWQDYAVTNAADLMTMLGSSSFDASLAAGGAGHDRLDG